MSDKETFWGVDASSWVNHPIEDERIQWAEYYIEDGKIKLTGNYKLSDIAPCDSPQILASGASDFNDWLFSHSEKLTRAIERRKNSNG